MTATLAIPADEWLAELFADELCAECGGDAEHHAAVPFLGNWFARCDHAPTDEGEYAPEIAMWRQEHGYERITA